jgi:hypothetical protein
VPQSHTQDNLRQARAPRSSLKGVYQFIKDKQLYFFVVESFHVKTAKKQLKWHHGSEIYQICIFCDLRHNSKKKTLQEHISKMYLKNPRAILNF